MNIEADHLLRLEKAVFQSKTDSEFYQTTYNLCAYILKNPTLSKILAESEKEYNAQTIKILNSNFNQAEKKELTARLEKFSICFDFFPLQIRIYDPIHDFKNSSLPDQQQDFVALLMLKGIKNIRTGIWPQKTLAEYNKWYVGKRHEYEENVRKLTFKLLNELGVLVARGNTSIDSPLSLNPSTGVFTIGTFIGTLNPKGQEYAVLDTLLYKPNNQATYLELINSFRPHVEIASKSQRSDLSKIINDIKVKLGEEHRKILKNLKNVGYRLEFTTPNDKR